MSFIIKTKDGGVKIVQPTRCDTRSKTTFTDTPHGKVKGVEKVKNG